MSIQNAITTTIVTTEKMDPFGWDMSQNHFIYMWVGITVAVALVIGIIVWLCCLNQIKLTKREQRLGMTESMIQEGITASMVKDQLEAEEKARKERERKEERRIEREAREREREKEEEKRQFMMQQSLPNYYHHAAYGPHGYGAPPMHPQGPPHVVVIPTNTTPPQQNPNVVVVPTGSLQSPPAPAKATPTHSEFVQEIRNTVRREVKKTLKKESRDDDESVVYVPKQKTRLPNNAELPSALANVRPKYKPVTK